MSARPSALTDRIRALQALAARHQDTLDKDTAFLSTAALARRWNCSVNTVRAIPRDDLPYLVLGGGLVRELRRYAPESVAAYEAKRLERAS